MIYDGMLSETSSTDDHANMMVVIRCIMICFQKIFGVYGIKLYWSQKIEPYNTWKSGRVSPIPHSQKTLKYGACVKFKMRHALFSLNVNFPSLKDLIWQSE